MSSKSMSGTVTFENLGGTDARKTKQVLFPSHLPDQTPTVLLSVIHFDVNAAFNFRLNLDTTPLENGFTVTATTWADSFIYKVTVQWTALVDG